MGLMLSCQKSVLQKYVGGDGVYFISVDSINYSFANRVGIIERDTILLKMIVLGDVKDYDRPLQLKAVEGTSAIENTHFILPNVVIKANTNAIFYPVVLMNSADLKTNTLRLELEVLQDTNFPQGAAITNNADNYNRFKINLSARLMKPSYWSSIESYFGEYSDVKYKFMIDVTGFSDFSTNSFGNTDLINIKGVMNIALQEYVDVNGPKLDENLKAISFPN